ncbi:hypothetical protein D770_16265 [Flammeovirgaceae bacterium 311]|nr:hypothetical protein D770_16265 [Flammeovirgaceae bacterium 311]
MVCLAPAAAQAPAHAQLQQAFEQHANRAVTEKVFVHTDKEEYLAGETMWFKLYVVDGSRHHPLDLSKVSYLEVLDEENKAVLQSKINLKKGTGMGSFYLPVSLKSGSYSLRAYTSWMKNFSPDFYFHKSITLINTFVVPEFTTEQATAAPDVQFFPEGGELVNGIRSKVAFKAVDSSGKGIAFKGAIVKEEGDTVALIEPLKFGMGHFYFTPEANVSYKAFVSPATDDSTVSTFPLPAARQQGYVMQLEDTGAGQLNINIYTTFQDQPVYLFVHTRQQVKVVEAQKTTAGRAVFRVNQQQLGDGISHITLLNQQKEAVAERLFFKQPTHTLSLEVQTDKKQYTTRQPVALQLAARHKSEHVPANLSLAVYRTDSLSDREEGNILSYLWLTSDLKGTIESPAYYFKQGSPELNEALDNLLLTQGWRRFRWKDVFRQQDAAPFTHVPEYEGHIIRAIVTDKNTGLPAAGIATYLSVPGKLVQFYTSISDENGEAQFITEQFFGLNDIIIQTEGRQAGQYNIQVADPYSSQISELPAAPFRLPDSYEQQLRLRHVQMQAQNTYWQQERNQLLAPKLDSAAFYRSPDKVYLLDNFTRFPTMEEVMREYVYEVRVRKNSGKFNFKVLNPVTREYHENPPLVLLNGVPVSDIDKIIDYNPLKVEKLEIVVERFFMGKDNMYDGIVSYTTYKGDLEGFPLPAELTNTAYDGLQLQREFYSPRYDTEQQMSNRKPDFRNLLHWSPQIITDEKGESRAGFYTSDLAGKFVVVVQGITPDGAAGVTTYSFEVKENTL